LRFADRFVPRFVPRFEFWRSLCVRRRSPYPSRQLTHDRIMALGDMRAPITPAITRGGTTPTSIVGT
jgi:hypothetical protein